MDSTLKYPWNWLAFVVCASLKKEWMCRAKLMYFLVKKEGTEVLISGQNLQFPGFYPFVLHLKYFPKNTIQTTINDNTLTIK